MPVWISGSECVMTLFNRDKRIEADKEYLDQLDDSSLLSKRYVMFLSSFSTI